MANLSTAECSSHDLVTWMLPNGEYRHEIRVWFHLNGIDLPTLGGGGETGVGIRVNKCPENVFNVLEGITSLL